VGDGLLIARGTGRAELLALVRESLHRFTERDALEVIRNPHASADVIEELLTSRTLLAFRAVRRAIALHPASPRHAALHCLEDLSWRDLMDVSRETRTPAPVRQAANQKLIGRLPQLSLGEKVSIARLSDRNLIPRLLKETPDAVFVALLRNSRLLPEDLIAWMSQGLATSPHLLLLARDPAWMLDPAVRGALLRNDRTPRAAALGVLSSGSRLEWRALMEDPKVHPLIAACAQNLYEGTKVIDRTR
jgi:hypothetical protein